MHKGFVLTIIGAVIAVLAAYQPNAWVWSLGLLWLMLFGLLNYDHHNDRIAIWNGLVRRDNALIYTKLVDAMMAGVETDTVAQGCNNSTYARERSA